MNTSAGLRAVRTDSTVSSIDCENDETELKYGNYWVTQRGMASD